MWQVLTNFNNLSLLTLTTIITSNLHYTKISLNSYDLINVTVYTYHLTRITKVSCTEEMLFLHRTCICRNNSSQKVFINLHIKKKDEQQWSSLAFRNCLPGTLDSALMLTMCALQMFVLLLLLLLLLPCALLSTYHCYQFYTAWLFLIAANMIQKLSEDKLPVLVLVYITICYICLIFMLLITKVTKHFNSSTLTLPVGWQEGHPTCKKSCTGNPQRISSEQPNLESVELSPEA